MNRDDIIRMAQEAGLYIGNPRIPRIENTIVRRLERFASLIASAERKACKHIFVRDEDSPLHYCCQQCGEIKKDYTAPPITKAATQAKGKNKTKGQNE